MTATKPASYHHGNLAAEILRRAAEIIDEQGIEALTLRGIARDLGVSHAAPNRHYKNKAALLSALATHGWLAARDATLGSAEATGSDDPHVRLNAMGRGFLRWALHNRALFRTLLHPDVSRHAESALLAANREFTSAIRDAVTESQTAGRHSGTALDLVDLYTSAVPIGAAMLLINPLLNSEGSNFEEMDEEALIAGVLDLVVPLPGVGA